MFRNDFFLYFDDFSDSNTWSKVSQKVRLRLTDECILAGKFCVSSPEVNVIPHGHFLSHFCHNFDAEDTSSPIFDSDDYNKRV